MLHIYEYIYPEEDGQVKFYPINDLTISDLIVLKNAETVITFSTDIENDKTVLILNEPINKNDYIILQLKSQKDIVIGDRDYALYKRYSGLTTLLNNQKYIGDINIELEKRVLAHNNVEILSNPYYYKIISTENQTSFILDKKITDKSLLEVYVNGALQSEGTGQLDGYQLIVDNTITNTEIVFNEGLEDGDIVLFRVELGTESEGEPIYQTLQTTIPIHFEFTSRYSPMYTCATYIQQDIGHVIDIDDSEINFVIWDESLKYLVKARGDGNLTYTLATPLELQDPSTIPYNVRMYIRYAVDYAILSYVCMSLLGNTGSVKKTLGDLTISKTTNLADCEKLLNWAKSKMDEYANSGDNDANTYVKSFIKGSGSSGWSLNGRNDFW